MSALVGKRIVVTRSREQAPVLCQLIEALGATAVSFPVIQFTPIHQSLKSLENYDWILFTSSNAVKYFQATIQPSISIGAVGSATLEALSQAKISVDFMPTTFTGEALTKGLGNISNKRILLPRAKIGRPEIVGMLREQGAIVNDVPLYDTVTAVPTTEAWKILNLGFDAITFTSPSSVRNFLKIVESRPGGFWKPAGSKKPTIACIGPSTKAEAEKFGLSVQAIPEKYTIEGLVQAVEKYYEGVERVISN